MNERINELNETIEQLKRSIDTLNSRINPAEFVSHFAQGYNQAIRFSIALLIIDIETIKTKINLIKDEKI